MARYRLISTRFWSFSVLLIALTLLTSGTVSTSSVIAADSAANGPVELLNVSNDPTRELFQDLNEAFTKQYQKQAGRAVTVKQSHGGSGSQARAVNDGLEADVVTLGMWPDTELVHRSGLIANGWEDRLPERSVPYYSTIVFVVRKGNPKNIHDWSDLAKPDVQAITPSPKTSGNGKWSFLGAWGSVLTAGGSEEDAKKLVTAMYQQAGPLDAGARGATISFVRKNLGDVLLTWENEGQLVAQESKGELQVVYPSVSVLANPPVAWVDEYVKRHGTEAVAKAYLEFLFAPEAQAIFAKHFYRPNARSEREKYADKFSPIKLFDITAVAKNWDEANSRFFNDGGVFDQIFESGK